MSVRRSDAVLAALAVGIALTVATVMAGRFAAGAAEPRRARGAVLAEALGLTDLALFTEARYTRHPTQADLMSPFLDHPGAREHFPSGALLAPPFPERRR